MKKIFWAGLLLALFGCVVTYPVKCRASEIAAAPVETVVVSKADFENYLATMAAARAKIDALQSAANLQAQITSTKNATLIPMPILASPTAQPAATPPMTAAAPMGIITNQLQSIEDRIAGLAKKTDEFAQKVQTPEVQKAGADVTDAIVKLSIAVMGLVGLFFHHVKTDARADKDRAAEDARQTAQIEQKPVETAK